MYAMACLLALLLSDNRGRTEAGSDSPVVATVDPAAVVAACEKMSALECDAFVKRLGKQKDSASLAAIYQSTVYDHDYAAAVATENMPHDKAVAFCSGFEMLSLNWMAAFRSLDSHPKRAVIGYVKKLAESSNPYIRVQCYRLCTKAGWDDLLEKAKSDTTNEAPICLMKGWVVHETVGWHARLYISTIEQKPKESKKAD